MSQTLAQDDVADFGRGRNFKILRRITHGAAFEVYERRQKGPPEYERKAVMKHRDFITGIVLAAGVLGAGAALAQAKGPMSGPMEGMGMHQRPSFEELDADKDGAVTAEEMMAPAKARFGQADADGDGKLSLEEMQAQARQRADEMAKKMLERMDRDGDGTVSFDEMPGQRRMTQAERMFARADADDDGTLSKEEFDRAGDRMGRHHGKRDGRGDGHRMGHGHKKGGDKDGCDGPMRQRMQDNN